MKRSPIHDIVADLKRRKLSGVTCLPKVNDAIDKPIFGKQELEILNTPLVAKNITQTSVQNYSSILKVINVDIVLFGWNIITDFIVNLDISF